MKQLFFDKNQTERKTLAVYDGAAVYLIAIIINLLIQLVASIVVLFMPDAGEESVMTVSLIIMAVLQAANLAVVYFATRRKKLALFYPIRALRWWEYLLSVLAAPACIICFILPANAFVYFLESIGYTFSSALSFNTPLNIVLGVIVTVILAPVCEELIFRGALLGGLTKKWGVVPAVLVSALCFSLMHMNPEQTVYQFFLGAVAGYLTVCARSVTPAILLHAGNNLIAVLLGFLPTEEGAAVTPEPIVFIIATVVLLFVGVALTLLLGRALAGKEKRWLLEEEKKAAAIEDAEIESGERKAPVMGKRTHIIMIAIGLGICLFMWGMIFLTNMLPAIYASLGITAV